MMLFVNFRLFHLFSIKEPIAQLLFDLIFRLLRAMLLKRENVLHNIYQTKEPLKKKFSVLLVL